MFLPQYSIQPATARVGSRHGLTLIELLVVIGILTVLIALLVPRLRLVNKDRNIRESARVVASKIASASQRAINEGSGGIEIQRNANIFDNEGVNYAGTIVYVLRKVPAYTGDDTTAVATIPAGGGAIVTIDTPWEQAELNVIQANDFISFNYSSVRYRILDVPLVPGTTMDLTLDVDAPMPPLPQASAGTLTVPFVIHRKPRRLESSRLELPEGYIVDLRASGSLYTPALPTPPLPATRPYWYTEPVLPPAVAQSVGYIFDRQGGIDLIYQDGFTFVPASQNQYLLIREYDPDGPDAIGKATDVALNEALTNPANLWVTVGRQTGATNVANIRPIDNNPAFTFADNILQAREIANLQQSATQ